MWPLLTRSVLSPCAVDRAAHRAPLKEVFGILGANELSYNAANLVRIETVRSPACLPACLPQQMHGMKLTARRALPRRLHVKKLPLVAFRSSPAIPRGLSPYQQIGTHMGYPTTICTT